MNVMSVMFLKHAQCITEGSHEGVLCEACY